ncbi:MAG: mechanosensitive ion channel [Verrucomicrobia bacterium]|nr:mechanosensitive ion channel [Verrucomicrobiota bacterium]
MNVFGIRWLALNAENGRKLLLSLSFIAAIVALRYLLKALTNLLIRGDSTRIERVRFWSRQAISLGSAVFILLGLTSIWFEDPARLAPAFGLLTAGLAFALQRVIGAVAGYFVILRGNTFTVGDRITMGGVRGDVVALGFIQTTIMEMGQIANADPTMWVKSRQFTGRIVTVSNAKVFDEPVYNYTRDFPYIWDEIRAFIHYDADRGRAEEILLATAHAHAVDPAKVSAEAHRHLEQKYHLTRLDFEPRVYYRITDNYLELTVRFVYETHGIRSVKDAMSRDILAGFDAAGLRMASPVREIIANDLFREHAPQRQASSPRDA